MGSRKEIVEHKTDRRQAVKTLGGLFVVGGALAVPRAATAQAKLQKESAPAARAPATGAAASEPSAPAAPAPPEAVIPSRGGEPPPQKLTARQLQLPALSRLIAPLKVGSRLGQAKLMSILGVHLGAATLTFAVRGATFQVDICLRDRGPGARPAVASTAKFDLYLANGGRGFKRTDTRVLRTVERLSRVITANEARAPALRLLTLRQRRRRHPSGKFDVRSAPRP